MSSSEKLEVFDYSSMSSSPPVLSATSSDSFVPAPESGYLSEFYLPSSPPSESGNERDLIQTAIGENLEWQEIYLGKGTFGKVIKVKHITEERYYAVKLIQCIAGEREKYRERELELLTEQANSPITHRNIVKYFDSWKCEETTPHYLCIRMELCDTSLEDLLWKQKNVVDDPQFYQKIFPQILSGLKYLHGIHWVHRDIYPPNILMANPEYDSPAQSIHLRVVKIADFGLARKLDQPSLTLSDPTDEVLSVVGNELYRAPEMKREIDPVSGSPMDPKYDYKVDLYSAGLVLYRLCRYFESPDAIKSELLSIKEYGLVDKHMLPRRDEVLHKLLDDLLKRNPEERLSASQALDSSSVWQETEAASSETNENK